jgi:hypothetical protein
VRGVLLQDLTPLLTPLSSIRMLALWGLISALHFCTLSVVINSFSPIEYVRQFTTQTIKDIAKPLRSSCRHI